MNNKDIYMLNKNGDKLLKPSPLKFIGAAISIGAGVIKGIGGYKKKKAAKAKEKAAQAALDKATKGLEAVDTSNPFADAKNAYAGLENKKAGLDNVYDKQKNAYADMDNKMAGQENAFEGLENKFEGMENSMEDLQVNTQQAEFEAQQNEQNQANIMSSMAGAAGGSGIAALAQSMANAGALSSQKASASIGAQEAQNTKMAAKAQQDIDMSIAGEGSKLQSMEAGEQSRLDTQSRQADMDIQATQMSAEESMQAAKLGEASKLQMVEADEASRLQTQEAGGEMSVQQMKGDGQLASASLEMQKQGTLMDAATGQLASASAEKEAGNKSMWDGIGGAVSGIAGLSDRRAKENIVKIKYSGSGIPIYHFNYIGEEQTWTGTMAQDLLELGRQDAVGTRGGFYTVNYNLIDVDMKKVIPSPLKQLGANPQEHAQKAKQQTDAGLDIIGGGAKILAWEDMQMDIKSIEPESMKLRKMKDKVLFDDEREKYNDQPTPGINPSYNKVLFVLIKELKEELLVALEDEDEEAKGLVQTKLAALKNTLDVVKQNITEFHEDHFASESMLSKGNSQQQISFGTQIYCSNPGLQIVPATKQDVLTGHTDYYGNIVVENALYAIVYDFYGNLCMINVMEGNKGMFIKSNTRALEYVTFLTETHDKAKEANAAKSAMKIDLGRINYKIDTMFGYNDGTASKDQDELVLTFCHDSDILKDGSTFRRHLYQHPNIEDLNYGGFDWDNLEDIMPLGPGDSKHWYDEIDEHDKMMLVDAIINVDNPNFNIKLLRTLVKEYYTTKIENAWWKGMGFEEGKLTLMRMKREKLNEARFKRDKAKAAQDGQLDFLFDGKVYPTGMTKAKVKEMEDERGKAAEKANPQLKK